MSLWCILLIYFDLGWFAAICFVLHSLFKCIYTCSLLRTAVIVVVSLIKWFFVVRDVDR